MQTQKYSPATDQPHSPSEVVAYTVDKFQITEQAIQTVKTSGSFIEGSILEGNMIMMRQIVGQKYCGLLKTYSVISCCGEQPAILGIKRELQAGKIFVQPLYNGQGHFVTVTSTAMGHARLLDSIGGRPTDLLKLQMWTLLGIPGEPLEVEMPSVHKQENCGNTCLICSSAFAIDTLNGIDVEKVEYGSSKRLRDWQLRIFQEGHIIAPPRRRRLSSRTKPDPNKFTITEQDATNLRVCLTAVRKLPDNPKGYAEEFEDGTIDYTIHREV